MHFIDLPLLLGWPLSRCPALADPAERPGAARLSLYIYIYINIYIYISRSSIVCQGGPLLASPRGAYIALYIYIIIHIYINRAPPSAFREAAFSLPRVGLTLLSLCIIIHIYVSIAHLRLLSGRPLSRFLVWGLPFWPLRSYSARPPGLAIYIYN